MGKTARKQPANLTIRGDLLRRAKARNINLSQTLEERLEGILKAQDRETWLKENQEAINAANVYIEKRGLWSDGLRQF
ncbi:MAG: type II toxin-antitoxin system CcdA family antitoxin [Chloroflexi bacterium]|nr:type II toxin-antitoxin system CcdA family antitoxin [Chloroflexota bacterium]